MKRALLGTIALVAVSIGSAAVARAQTWNGLYVGAALGGKWGHTTWTTTSLQSAPFSPIVDASSPRNYDPTSVRFGGFLGYNWEFAPWVWGIEIDLAYADKTVTAAGIPGCSILCIVGFPGPLADSSSVRMRWDASARTRLGYMWWTNVLVYGTAGIALQNIETSATCQHSAPDPLCLVLAGNPFATATNSANRFGPTVGVGIDVKFASHWFARAEYRYAYFGTRSDVLNLSLPGAPAFVNYGLKVETHIATLGLAYKF